MEFSLAKTHRFQAYLLHSPQPEVDVDATVLNPQFVGQDRPGPRVRIHVALDLARHP